MDEGELLELVEPGEVDSSARDETHHVLADDVFLDVVEDGDCEGLVG